MTFPAEELPDVAEAAHAVVQEAKDAGVWLFGGGLKDHEEASVVATDGTVTDGLYSADSRSWTCPHASRRCSGLPRSPSPAAGLKRSASSCPTRPSDRGPATASSCPPLANGTARPGITRLSRRSQSAARIRDRATPYQRLLAATSTESARTSSRSRGRRSGEAAGGVAPGGGRGSRRARSSSTQCHKWKCSRLRWVRFWPFAILPTSTWRSISAQEIPLWPSSRRRARPRSGHRPRWRPERAVPHHSPRYLMCPTAVTR